MCGRQPNSTDAAASAGIVVIRRQNKDVCRDCDKAVWRHADSGMRFKWCKGCKNFRNLTAFVENLAGSKCDVVDLQPAANGSARSRSKCDFCRERANQVWQRRQTG